MKNLKIMLSLISISLLLFSCGGDEDDASKSNGNIQGDWTAISYTANVNATSIVQGSTTVSNAIITGSEFNYEINFDDNKWTTSGNYEITSEVSIVGIDGSIVMPETIYVNNDNGEYSIDGNQLTASDSFYEFEVNGLPMIQTSNESETATYSIDGDELTITKNITNQSDQSSVDVTVIIESTSVWVKK